MMDNNKSIYGLVGYPLGHSFSRSFFTNQFKSLSVNAEYLNFEIPEIDIFPNVLKHNNLCGLNITIPYKQAVIPFLDRLDKEAERIGAVNVVKIKKVNGMISTTGYNSDIYGFKMSILPILKPHHSQALILGTGGASKAVACALEDLRISYQFVSRKKTNDNLSYDDLNEGIIKSHTLIINTTPLGMSPNIDNCPNIPYGAITQKHLCYDLIYNPKTTKFLKQAFDNGATIMNGAEMLRLQALKSWEIWNSK